VSRKEQKTIKSVQFHPILRCKLDKIKILKTGKYFLKPLDSCRATLKRIPNIKLVIWTRKFVDFFFKKRFRDLLLYYCVEYLSESVSLTYYILDYIAFLPERNQFPHLNPIIPYFCDPKIGTKFLFVFLQSGLLAIQPTNVRKYLVSGEYFYFHIVRFAP
jgi:hypothetical protein